jgi:hypothetical protein
MSDSALLTRIALELAEVAMKQTARFRPLNLVAEHLIGAAAVRLDVAVANTS